MTSLVGKWSFVTGASRGVGGYLAAGLAQLGSNLVLHSRDLAHTTALAKRLEGLGIKVVTVAAELADPSQVDSMLDDVQASAHIDILYNNAAIQVPKQSVDWQTSVEDLRQSLEVNLISLIRICDRLAPPMLAKGWGQIVLPDLRTPTLAKRQANGPGKSTLIHVVADQTRPDREEIVVAGGPS